MSDLCIVCGAPIPEGRQICPRCEKQTIKDSGDRTVFPTGAVRDMHQGKGRYDLIPWEALHELALHCEAGARKYGERNVEKGIPISSLVDSAFRHLSKYMQGMNDEPHLRAALWNVAWAIWMEKRKPEMQDIPTRLKHDQGKIKTPLHRNVTP